MWAGIKTGFAPVLAVFAPFEPLLSAIGAAFSGMGGILNSVIGWIAELITPVQGSTEDMQRWASSGEALGQVLGAAFRLLLSPVTLVVEAIGKIIEGVGWLWENGSKIGDFASDMGSSVKGWFGFGDTAAPENATPEPESSSGWSWFGGGSKKPAAPAAAQSSSSTPASTPASTSAPKVGAAMPAASSGTAVATPAAASQASRPSLTTPQSVNQNNTFNTTVTVTAPPGTDYQALARLVEDKVKELLRRYNSDTAALYD